MPAATCPYFDADDLSMGDHRLACACDREWASLNGDRPGVWRVRPRIGREAPRGLQRAPDATAWVLVVIQADQTRIRCWYECPEVARVCAVAQGLRAEHER
jgi:hypothetical protein